MVYAGFICAVLSFAYFGSIWISFALSIAGVVLAVLEMKHGKNGKFSGSVICLSVVGALLQIYQHM